jgi:hypothetical protein
LTRYYRYHGLVLGANEPLARLDRVEGATCDIAIHVLEPGELPRRDLPWVVADAARESWRAAAPSGTWLRLRWGIESEWAELVVNPDGSEVWVGRAETVLWPDACELLLGPFFSCVMAQRGVTCVHAAVVMIDGRVVALVGQSGTGKSTTTTAFLNRGAALVADDVAVLTEVHGHPAVQPGSPRLRLLRETADALTESYDALEPMWLDEPRRPPKRYLVVDDDSRISDEGPVAIDGVYFLGQRDATAQAPEITPLTPPQALAGLMAHRHMVTALDARDHQRDFATLARLAQTVPARELRRPDGLASVGDTLDLISADARLLACT